MKARIALVSVNAGRNDTNAHWPHYGLVLLATILRDQGHKVQVFDQSCLRVARVSPRGAGSSVPEMRAGNHFFCIYAGRVASCLPLSRAVPVVVEHSRNAGRYAS